MSSAFSPAIAGLPSGSGFVYEMTVLVFQRTFAFWEDQWLTGMVLRLFYRV